MDAVGIVGLVIEGKGRRADGTTTIVAGEDTAAATAAIARCSWIGGGGGSDTHGAAAFARAGFAASETRVVAAADLFLLSRRR